MGKKKKSLPDNTIAVNRKARHEYTLEKSLEAGVVLEGWEVKSLRAGKASLIDSHIIIKKQEAWLLGANITPLPTASKHVETDPTRTRKLLLHHEELKKLIGATQQKGYTIVALKLYWKQQRVKLEIALAKGKKLHDKRATEKARDWKRQKSRLER
ncbi:MAG: SsrA-binding protein SmpB [Gammaproteobacteria bacterium]